MTGLDDYPTRYCPVCDTVVPAQFLPGPAGRPDASCPNCRSLERHRFIAIMLGALAPMLGSLDTLLDIAPSPQVTPLLARLEPQHHLRMDLGADNRLVDVLGSLTDLPLPDDSVDLLVCYHVLEHIPDDRKAMAEIARVVRPGGLALLQVPWRPGTRTDEDPDAPEDERIRRFGQADHVRYYGDDFEDRLVAAGLSFERLVPRALLGESMCRMLKLFSNEMVWLARPATGASVPARTAVGTTSMTRALDSLVDAMASDHAALTAARSRISRLEAAAAEVETRGTGAELVANARRLAGRAKRAARRRIRAARARRGSA